MTAVRFPPNDLTTIIDERPRYNLSGSAGPDLRWSDLVELGALDALRDLPIGYSTSRGGDRLRAAIARSIGVQPADVIATTGAAGALFLTNFVLAGPGDEVVTVSPNFPPTVEAIDAAGATRRSVRISFDEGYRLSLDRLADALSERTALVILVSPGNPSGVSSPREELESALRLIRERAPRARTLVDETFRAATFGDARPLPSAASWDDQVLVCGSLSKCHGSPGLRVGWLVCRDDSLRRRLGAAKMGTVIACGTIDEALATLVLDQEDRVLARQRAALGQAIERVAGWVRDNRAYLDWVRPDAGAICTMRLRADRFSDDDAPSVRAAFAAAGVKVAAGPLFGDEARVFRLGFGGMPLADLTEALAAMAEILPRCARPTGA